MRLLLDTHVFLALIDSGSVSLPAGIRHLLENPENEFQLSVASLWEIAIKARLGKLTLRSSLQSLPELLTALGIGILAVNEHHALVDISTEPETRDPFDRMLLAQCQVERLRLVTIDRALISHALAYR